MKKLLFYIGCGLLFGACGERLIGGGTPVLLHSYIVYYVDGTPQCWASNAYTSGSVYIPAEIGLQCMGYDLYKAPEIGGEGAAAEKFLQLAERNGDRTYNKEVVFVGYLNRECRADNYREIRVVCTNAAWDEAHPVGASLNDIVTVAYGSAAEFVRSGYTTGGKWDNGFKGISKRPADLTEEDLAMVSTYMYIRFDSHPATGKYEMEVTLVTTEGEEQVSTCTFDFDEPKTAV